MDTVKRITSLLLFAVTTLLLAACGGGGGGDGSGDVTVPTAPATGVSITADNVELISAEVLGTADILEEFRVSSDLLSGVQVDAAGSDFNFPDFFVQQLQRLPALAISSNDVSVAGVIVPQTTEFCDFNNGTTTISGEVSDPNALTVGDEITIQFDNCELEGDVLNGTITMTITGLSPDFDFVPPYTLGVNIVLSVFSINDGVLVVSADGDMSMVLTENLNGDEILELSGNSLTAWSGSEVETLTNYHYDVTSNMGTGAYSIDLNGTLASTVIGGSVIFESTQTFTGNEFVGDGNPVAGILWITTSIDASQAMLTAQDDGVAVWIEVDPDGDDIYEEPIMTTWSMLEDLL